MQEIVKKYGDIEHKISKTTLNTEIARFPELKAIFAWEQGGIFNIFNVYANPFDCYDVVNQRNNINYQREVTDCWQI